MANLFEECGLQFLIKSTLTHVPGEAVVEVSLFWKGARPPYTARRGGPSDVQSLGPLPKQVLQHIPLAVCDRAGQLVPERSSFKMLKGHCGADDVLRTVGDI